MNRIFGKIMGYDPVIDNSSFKALVKNMKNTKYEISELDASLDYVTDPILMNQIIFQRKAAEMRYRYWYKLAKENRNTSE